MATAMASPRSAKQKRYLAALVLGTALSAIGSVPGAPAVEMRAVQDISRYCTACWRNARLDPGSWGDCTQEVFSRLLERVPQSAWSHVLKDDAEERRELVRAIDAVKKRTQRGRRLQALADDVPERYDPDTPRLAEQRAEVRTAAEDLLSPRQRQIVQWSLEGWSVRDMAAELKLPADRVSDEKYKAVRKLRDHFAPAYEA